MQSSPRSRDRLLSEWLPYLALCGVVLVICGAAMHSARPGSGAFWDARSYEFAIKARLAHQDPYRIAYALPFLYPPLFVLAAARLCAVVPGWFCWDAYVALTFLAFLALPALVAAYCRRSWCTAPVALCLLLAETPTMGLNALLTGNIATLLNAIVLAAGIPGIRRGRWTYFYLAVLAAACVKILFLTFLLLPLFAGRRQLRGCVSTVAAYLAIDRLQALLVPGLYHEYATAAVQRALSVAPGTISLYRLLLAYLPGRSANAALLLTSLLLAALVTALLLLRRRAPQRSPNELWIPLLLLAAYLTNFRLERYDADVAFLLALYLLVECMRSFRPTPARQWVLGVGMAACALVALHDPPAGVCLSLLLAAGSTFAAIRLPHPRQKLATIAERIELSRSAPDRPPAASGSAVRAMLD
jgi:hypothetical protein